MRKVLSLKEIIMCTQGKLICGSPDTLICNISTDTRKTGKDDLFVALIGERFDGHDFIGKAFELGAAAVVASRPAGPAGTDVPAGLTGSMETFETIVSTVLEGSVGSADPVILSEGRPVVLVNDTLKALQDIAACYRGLLPVPLVAVTGSVGKTSTKDMIASALKQAIPVLKTEGNLNNEIGLPLTLLNLEDHHRAAVVEMGMSGFGEISRLSKTARPDIAVITNIGLSHIEKLGSRENILKAKLEILDGLAQNGPLVLNGDDSLLRGLRNVITGNRIIYYGINEGADIRAYNIETLGEEGTIFRFGASNKEYTVRLKVPGIHNVYNALAAIAVGMELKIGMDDIIKGIEDFTPGKMRLNIFICGNNFKVIDDVYNASPKSMEAAIDVLISIGQDARKIAVLADMLEMGDWAREAHKSVGTHVSVSGIDYLITVGKDAVYIAEGATEAGMDKSCIHAFGTNEEAVGFLKGFLRSGDHILVKGSRGMKMERVVEALKNF